jgi:copper chaperone CopZ
MAPSASPLSPRSFQRSLKKLSNSVGFGKRSAATLIPRTSEADDVTEDAPLLLQKENGGADLELGDFAVGNELLTPDGQSLGGIESTAHIRVTGMTCSACSASVEQAVGSLDGVRSVSVALLQNMAEVVFDPQQVPVSSSAGLSTNSSQVRNSSGQVERSTTVLPFPVFLGFTPHWAAGVFRGLVDYLAEGFG